MLEIRNLEYSYTDGDQRRYIINNCNGVFNDSTFYTIVGPSGCGKTTLISLIAGLDQQSSGDIIINNNILKSNKLERYRKKEVAIIFQQYNLIKYLTAVENVLYILHESGLKHKNSKQIAYKILENVGIVKSKANRYSSNLSGGECQRVAIAKAIASNANIIVADEPTGNLDEETSQEIINLFKKLSHTYNKTVIVVTHSNSLAKNSDICFRLINNKLEE